LTPPRDEGIVRCDRMSEIRELRRRIDLSQKECAALLEVSVETFRTWDSGRRAVPLDSLHRARRAIAEHAWQTELLPLNHPPLSWVSTYERCRPRLVPAAALVHE